MYPTEPSLVSNAQSEHQGEINEELVGQMA